MKASILAAGAAVFALAGCSTPEESATANLAEAGNETIAAKPTPAPRDKTPEESFADSVAAANSYVMAAGALAQEKGGSAAIKAYGKMISDDHNQSTMKLKMAAKDVEGGLFIDPTLSVEQERNLQTLQKASGPDFDSAFVSQQIAAQTKLMAIVDDYRLTGKQQPLTIFASWEMAKLRAHLARAKAL